MIRSMKGPTRAETSEASDVPREKETYRIMTINMKYTGCKGKGAAAKGKDLITSTIKRSSASVIFCQEAPGMFKKEVVAICGNDRSSYNFVPKDIQESIKHKFKVAVMWCETNFEGKEVDLTQPEERLKREKSVADGMVQVIKERSAMVKLTSTGTAKASFLAVSWHAIKLKNVDEALEAFYGLICFAREVCENEKLCWFVIGGDFQFDTSKVYQTEVEGVTISCGPSIVPFKDIFVFSVSSMNKLPMTVDITLSEVKPLELENERSGNAKPLELENKRSENAKLQHVPVVRVLNLVQEKGKLDQYFQSRTFRRTFVYITTL